MNIGIFAASSGGRKERRHIGRFTPDQERSHVWHYEIVPLNVKCNVFERK